MKQRKTRFPLVALSSRSFFPLCVCIGELRRCGRTEGATQFHTHKHERQGGQRTETHTPRKLVVSSFCLYGMTSSTLFFFAFRAVDAGLLKEHRGCSGFKKKVTKKNKEVGLRVHFCACESG